MDDQRDVVSFLSSSAAYGTTEPVEHHETHGSHVFLSRTRAYKLKRAVRYPYMDYSTVDRRRRMCEREVSVNRRTAPRLYLGVRAIVRNEQGNLTLANDTASDAVDWVVEMRRFGEEALLDKMCRRGELTLPLTSTLAEQVADFHATAEVQKTLAAARRLAGSSPVISRPFATPAPLPSQPASWSAGLGSPGGALTATVHCSTGGRMRASSAAVTVTFISTTSA